MTFDGIKSIIESEFRMHDGECHLVDSLSNKTIAFPDFRHHLPPFEHTVSETTNMSDCEETKGSAPGVGTPLRLNRLEMSTFSEVNCSRHQFDQFDHVFFFPSSTTQFDRSFERETLVDNQVGTTVEKN